MSRTAARSRQPATLLASVFGCGFSPVAPGTVGSAAALFAAEGLRLRQRALLPAIAAALAAGVWATKRAGGGEDHGWIVIDEVAGQWITLLGLWGLPSRRRPAWLGAAFLLFRLLDITKPGPVGRLDRRHDAVGVMGDDAVAGLIAAGLLALARKTLP